MKRYLLVILCLALGCGVCFAQSERKSVRRGNRQFKKEKYEEADISYRKALMKDTSSVAAHYNLAGNLYRQQNMEEAAKQLEAVQLTAGEEKNYVFLPESQMKYALAIVKWAYSKI